MNLYVTLFIFVFITVLYYPLGNVIVDCILAITTDKDCMILSAALPRYPLPLRKSVMLR